MKRMTKRIVFLLLATGILATAGGVMAAISQEGIDGKDAPRTTISQKCPPFCS
jgi:hypothetical protein